MTAFDRVVAALSEHRFRTTNEADLQAAIARLFDSLGIEYAREVHIGRGAADRIDFLCGHVGVEVKVQGSVSEIARQLQRYADSKMVEHLVLATTMRRHAVLLDDAKFGEKRVRVVRLAGGFL